MSIYHTLANLKRPKYYGVDRYVYYSRKLNLIIKKDRPCSSGEQTRNELSIYKTMTPEEKKVFPVVRIMWYRGKVHIFMKNCPSLCNKYRFFNGSSEESLDDICDTYGLSKANNTMIRHIAEKYCRQDLHSNNIGVDPDTNALVILDMGF